LASSLQCRCWEVTCLRPQFPGNVRTNLMARFRIRRPTKNSERLDHPDSSLAVMRLGEPKKRRFLANDASSSQSQQNRYDSAARFLSFLRSFPGIQNPEFRHACQALSSPILERNILHQGVTWLAKSPAFPISTGRNGLPRIVRLPKYEATNRELDLDAGRSTKPFFHGILLTRYLGGVSAPLERDSTSSSR
jgi:hypothetical protein